ncbi:MAG TPA: expansin EXLX1 family cellulose-binding protein [Kineosporiaceae bacterium]|nr:expansin EXLX1 family cellulose-binding protein [Kineosporiaceae bacterium]
MPLSLVAALRAVFSAAASLALAATGSQVTPSTSATKPAPSTSRATAGPVVRGQATHYGPASAGGNCSFPTVPADKFTVAAGPDLYAHGAACGGYLSVSANGRTIRVKIDNQCPECRPGHLDLTDEAFAALAPLGKGLIAITYRPVTNPRITGGLTFVVKTGSSRYWLGLLVDNAGNRLRSVEIRAGGTWKALTRTDYGYWLAPSGAGAGPFTVRVTDVAGHRATASGVRLSPDAVQRTAVRLYR